MTLERYARKKIRTAKKPIQKKIGKIIGITGKRRKIQPVRSMWTKTTPRRMERKFREKIRALPSFKEIISKVRPALGDYVDATKKIYTLGPSRIIKISLTTDGMKFFNEIGKTMIPTVAMMMNQLADKIYYRGRFHIFDKVPEDTGKLRSDMSTSLRKENNIVPLPTTTNAKDLVLDIKISATMPYASIVNQMKESQLRHYGNIRSRKTGRPLYDPFAVYNFFQKIRTELKKEINLITKGNWRNPLGTPMLDEFFKLIGINKELFKVSMR